MKHPPLITACLLVLASAAGAQNAVQYLPVCSRCLNPRVISKSGVGTAAASAEAKVVAADAATWCAANMPRYKYCVNDEVKQGGDGAKNMYRASADCTTGQLNSMNGGAFSYAGVWADGPGKGRPRFVDGSQTGTAWETIRRADGKARGDYNIFEGYSLAGQWEVLCGGTAPSAAKTPGPAQRQASRPAPAPESPSSPPPAAQSEWLAVCSRCPSPEVVSKSGIGTANARAEARMTREELKNWCAESDPANAEACLRQQLAGTGNKVYRATADCPAGRITAIDEKTYSLAGVWDNSDIGGGRTKWRDAEGQIAGRDNASNGLAISQQWELLCPGPPPPARAAAAPAAPLRAQAAQVASAPVAAPPVCGDQPLCTEVNSFAATVADFRTSNAGRAKVVAASVRFQNKLSRPIILAYVNGSGITTDDQGNRYTAYSPEHVRGIGVVANNKVDPKFILRPGESGDARVEMIWQWSGREIIGLTFDMELTVREVLPLRSGQFRLGPEHPLRFRGLANEAPSPVPAVTSAPVAAPAPPAAATAPAPTTATAPETDVCAGKPRCFNAGLFTAQIAQMTASQEGNRRDHIVRLNVRFQNTGSQPIILAYVARSSVVIDNYGTRYYWGTAGTYDMSATGIGKLEGNKADPQFVLGPGESRAATFQLMRDRSSRQPAGASFNYDVSIARLEVLPSQQIRTVREYTLNFQNLAAGGPVAPLPGSIGGAARKLGDILNRKKLR
jgi:hypothetical protein